MTSSNGKIFRVTDPLCGIFTGHRWIPLTQRPVTLSFGVFFDLRLNKRLSNQTWGWLFEMPSRSWWRHRNECSRSGQPIVTKSPARIAVFTYWLVFQYSVQFLSFVNDTPTKNKHCTKYWSLQWRHNERDGVSNHWRLHCLLNSWFRRRSKKSSKLRVTGLGAGTSPVTGEFPAQKASNAENVPFDDVIMMILEWRGRYIEVSSQLVTDY